jgi:hypothetical protein
MRLLYIVYCFLTPIAGLFSQVTFTVHTISTSRDGVFSISSADIDNDGRVDFLSTSYNEGVNREEQNQESFSSYTFDISEEGVFSLITADFDGDGSIDVLSGNYDDGTISWHENNAADKTTTNTIQRGSAGVESISNIDFEDDGDMDILSASFTTNTITWFQNDGSGNFTEIQDDSDENEFFTTTKFDIDNDGVIDELTAAYGDQSVSWYRMDKNGTWSTNIVSIDGDISWTVGNKIDVVNEEEVFSVLFMDESALHFRSKNSNGFLTQTVKAPDERYVVSTIDIDIDGDKDFLFAFFVDDYSAPLDSAQGLLTEKTIFFPNPTTDQFHIKYDKNTSTHYVIYDLLGREVNHQNKMGVHHSLDVSFLAKGSYLIKAMDDEETTYFRAIKN